MPLHWKRAQVLTLTKCHHVVRLLAGSATAHPIHGEHPETVHGKGKQTRDLVVRFVTVGQDSIVHVPVTVLADPVKADITINQD